MKFVWINQKWVVEFYLCIELPIKISCKRSWRIIFEIFFVKSSAFQLSGVPFQNNGDMCMGSKENTAAIMSWYQIVDFLSQVFACLWSVQAKEKELKMKKFCFSFRGKPFSNIILIHSYRKQISVKSYSVKSGYIHRLECIQWCGVACKVHQNSFESY